MEDYTVKELMEKVRAFCSERDWDQFHNPKDIWRLGFQQRRMNF